MSTKTELLIEILSELKKLNANFAVKPFNNPDWQKQSYPQIVAESFVPLSLAGKPCNKCGVMPEQLCGQRTGDKAPDNCPRLNKPLTGY